MTRPAHHLSRHPAPSDTPDEHSQPRHSSTACPDTALGRGPALSGSPGSPRTAKLETASQTLTCAPHRKPASKLLGPLRDHLARGARGRPRRPSPPTSRPPWSTAALHAPSVSTRGIPARPPARPPAAAEQAPGSAAEPLPHSPSPSPPPRRVPAAAAAPSTHHTTTSCPAVARPGISSASSSRTRPGGTPRSVRFA